MREIIIIAAMSENRVIGKDNKLPWSIKEDMRHFKELTEGYPCIMGRKTWESLPKKPLPGRLNVIVSRTLASTPQDVVIAKSFPAAIERCSAYEKVFIIGGEAIYRQAMPFANKIELTLVRGNYDGDAFFPQIDPALWMQTAAVDFDTFSFLSYSKIVK